ncbi:hypothetical protein MMC30_003886 [Trapelia coarctata]|nr:hypothetical protein [Trapelia coarctata]
MENPAAEIPHIIRSLVQTPPSIQRATIERYFTPDASFTHPFCRTGSFNGSRWLIWCIYRWYKIMSPRIEIEIDSVAFDPPTLTLYVSMHQILRIWFIPGYSAPVKLVTVLKLIPSSSTSTTKYPSATPPSSASNTTSTQRPKTTYLIQSQNDLYQVNEFITFWSPFRLLWVFVLALQWMATAACVVGMVLGTPVSWVEENMVGGNRERRVRDIVVGT